MPAQTLVSYQRQNRLLDFLSLKHAAPKGIYVVPSPDDPCQWSGILFVRQGLYATAVLRFHISFPVGYPARPPSITFSTDIFHPLVTPLTTYTYTTQDTGAETVSSDDERLPPGGLSLRHGFPQWFDHTAQHDEGDLRTASPRDTSSGPPHIVEVLYYMRTAFISEALLDALPLSAAANPGAWHAWRTYRAKKGTTRSAHLAADADHAKDPAMPPVQQPGGARKPSEWNWAGVWEERLRRSIRASQSEHAIYSTSSSADRELINFLKMDPETTRFIANEQFAAEA